jgi:integrase/recombinase XerC
VEASRIDDLREVTTEVAADFVGARLETGQRPTLATQYNRRAALRMLYASARRLGLADSDPTLDLALPPVDSTAARPLTDDEVERCRDVAQWSTSQVAAAWALAEATARGVEIALVSARDIDLENHTVELPGGARTQPRRGALTSWGVAALGRRLKASTAGQAVAFAGSSRAAGQASTCRAISSVLVRAGLAGQPGVRPASVAGWAGRRVFDETASIEAAARAMGVRRLDRAARLIGLDWSTDA